MFYKVIRAIAIVLIKALFFVKYNNREVLNSEELKGGYIIAANHISMVDPVIVACAERKRYVHFMAKIELFKNKFLAWLLHNLKAFSVDRSKADLNAVKTSLSLLKNGHILGIFPQGTRVAPDESSSAKLGAVQFAFKTNSPIVPVGIYTKGGRVKVFRRVFVTFGKPIILREIGIQDAKPDSLIKASDYLMNEISQLMEHHYE